MSGKRGAEGHTIAVRRIVVVVRAAGIDVVEVISIVVVSRPEPQDTGDGKLQNKTQKSRSLYISVSFPVLLHHSFHQPDFLIHQVHPVLYNIRV